MSLDSDLRIQGSTKLEKMIEETYYIYPPKKYLFTKVARVWLALFGCVIASIGFLTMIFFVVYVFLFLL